MRFSANILIFLSQFCSVSLRFFFSLIDFVRNALQVYLYGGHVTSWKNENGEELLYLSSKVLHHLPPYLRFEFHVKKVDIRC